GLERAAHRVPALIDALFPEELGSVRANFTAGPFRWGIAAFKASLQRHFRFCLAVLVGPTACLALVKDLLGEGCTAVAAPGGIGNLAVVAALVEKMAGLFLALVGVSPGHEARLEGRFGHRGAAVGTGGRRGAIAALETLLEKRS